MEVHYHPHKESQKKWKEYLIDFFMIFLAVTLGFFSENFKEHLSDTNREREYIESFIQNLQTDVGELKELLADKEIMNGYDSLFKVDKTGFLKLPVQDSLFYYSVRYISTIRDFKQTDFTIIQLRNAGGYRLIQKRNVADSISKYEEKNDNIKMQSALMIQSFLSQFNYFDQIFDLSKVSRVFNGSTYASHIPGSEPVLITNDYNKIALYINQCYQTNLIYRGYRSMLNNHLNYLNRLIIFLKMEYHIN